jgi:hypothetical protein
MRDDDDDDDDDDYAYTEVSGMRIGKGNQSTGRRSASVPFCPPQILHDLTWYRNRAAAVGNRQITT